MRSGVSRHTPAQLPAVLSEARLHLGRPRFAIIEAGWGSSMVSIGDLVVSTLSIEAHTIDQLETYIANKYPK